jgi:predicted ATPase/DNA-binding SARP family transcriptional activator
MPDAGIGAPAVAAPPLALTRFIGRVDALAGVEALLANARLLTITGAGGSGKTRLALEVARRAAARDAASVAWVELAPVTTPELVAQHVASAVGLREEGGAPTLDTLLAFLRARTLLIVLDNCEHLVDACAALAGSVLRASPGVRILATSREPLGVSGERAWLIPALSLPRRDGDASEAVDLFAERARDALPGFELSAANRTAVVQICRRLEGMPLAIELAAARVRVLPPEQLAAKLDDAFRALGAGSRTALPRHRTLRAVMDWSYTLLTGAERTLLHRLSVFEGGFTLDAVEHICAAPPLAADDVLDLLAALVDRSLVAMRERDGVARYRLLDTVRQYAAERVRADGGDALLRQRHAAYFVQLVEQAEPHLTRTTRRAWVDVLQRDANNIRQALAWTREHAPFDHLRLTGMLCWYWFSTRDWVEARRWLDGALALPDAAAPTRERAAALFANGALATLQGRTGEPVAWLEESAALAAALGDARLEAYALNYLGMAHLQTGSPAGEAPVRQALAWYAEANDLYGLRLSKLLLSTLEFSRGRLDEAQALTTEAVRIARLFGVNRELGVALQMHAGVALLKGDLALAAATARESLAALRNDPMYLFAARGLDLLGTIALAQGDAHEAVRMCGAAAGVRSTIGAQPFVMDRVRIESMLADVRQRIGDEAFDAAWRAGSALDYEAAIDRAIACAGLMADGAGAGTHNAMTERRGGDRRRSDRRARAPDERATPRYRVQALGGFQVLRGGEPLPISHSRPRELFAYLLSHPGGQTREQIGLVFWPDASAAQVKNRFHVALHHLRRALGSADCIVLDGERYRVNPEAGIGYDVDEFSTTITAALRDAKRGGQPIAALRSGLELYAGPFLDGMNAGDWHLDVHDRLLRLCVDGHAALGSLLASAGDHAGAAASWERLLRFDPLHEDAHRELMRCFAACGERSRALLQYERLVALLRDELDAEPEAATRDLVETLRVGDAARSAAAIPASQGDFASRRAGR